MLKTLIIRNYALIEELTVAFEPGLNIMTGETGAGKSIIIDALSLVLGERAEAGSVRKGADKAVVEAGLGAAGNKRLAALLERNQIEWTDELILRREVSSKGQSRSFINDTPCTLGVLKDAGDLLVDLHGQHEHQSLLHAESHIDLLDDYGRLEGLVEEFGSANRLARALLREIEELKSKEQQLMEKRVLYEFQINEIDAVRPHAGEPGELEAELTILENAERLFGATEKLFQMLYEGENAVHDQLVIARNELEALAGIDKAFQEPRSEAASAAVIVDELAKFVQRYNSKVEFKPDRLEEIRSRLGQLSLLKKKYGGSIETILHHRETIGREFELANNFQKEIESLESKLCAIRSAASTLAFRLSIKRAEVAKKINKAVGQALASLGITHAVFETSIVQRRAADHEKAIVTQGVESYESTETGIDFVEFYVSTNVGEDPKPLVKVASGGEISRIMLALKMILAKSDQLPLLVFDEIDVGVSGRIAQAVGQHLKKLSEFHQVIAITHLPQIAGLADTHYIVEKVEGGGRSFTRLRKLELEQRVGEVARLMSGEEITQTGLKSARELMDVR